MGRESVEVISYPGVLGGDILRTGALPLFIKKESLNASLGMQLLFRVFRSSPGQLGYKAPTAPTDFSVPCGHLHDFHCLRQVMSSTSSQSLASSVFGAILDQPGTEPRKVVVKFGEDLDQEVRYDELSFLFTPDQLNATHYILV